MEKCQKIKNCVNRWATNTIIRLDMYKRVVRLSQVSQDYDYPLPPPRPHVFGTTPDRGTRHCPGRRPGTNIFVSNDDVNYHRRHLIGYKFFFFFFSLSYIYYGRKKQNVRVYQTPSAVRAGDPRIQTSRPAKDFSVGRVA